ncbi:MAG: hypothetical protein ACRDHL_01660, partial [Candidatus Promineifilaceae bacterium]
MSEENQEAFVEEGAAGAGRGFLVAAGLLIGIFILLTGCVLTYVLAQRGEQAQRIAEREAQNATIIAQNALVTLTVEAQQAQLTAEAQPSDTPVPPPTNTPRPTRTPSPEPSATPEPE